MRKLTINTFMTLDGVIQAPGGPEEDPTDGFTHGGWSAGYWDDDMNRKMGDVTSRPFALLLGRKTYEIFAAYWPHADDQPLAAPLNNATKYVASRTLQQVDWKNSKLLRGDATDQVAKLKHEQGPEIQVYGSANLIQTLLKHDLIDEFRIWTFPVVLGKGKRLFDDGAIPAGLRVLGSTTSSTGVVIVEYARADGIKYGSLALEQPAEEELERRKHLSAR